MSVLPGVIGAVALAAVYLYSLGKAAGKKTPKPEPKPEAISEPYISWRVVMDEYGIPASVSLDMNPATEKLLATHEWVKLP